MMGLVHIALFAAGDSEALRSLEFDWPATPARWSIFLGVLALMVIVAVGVYRRDARDLGRFWRYLLTALRLTVIAALVVIVINPQERTRQIAFRPSRVAVLVDTSLSMRFPAESVSGPAASAPTRTRADAVRELLSGSKLLSDLRKQHNVRLFTFDSTLVGPQAVLPSSGEVSSGVAPTSAQASPVATAPAVSQPGSPQAAQTPANKTSEIDWQALVQPRGLETRLGESLIETVRQMGGRTLSGIVVISDGNSNAGVEPSNAQEVAKAAQARIITVGVGSTEQPVNLQVVSVQAPSDVHVGDPYDFSAFVQAFGLVGKSATVELLSRPEGDDKTPPKVIATRDIPIREDGAPIEVKFRETPTIAGGIEYYVRARPPAGVRELSDDDNQRHKTVNVVDRKLRVLVIASGPMRDYRFLHTMLYRHSSINVDVWLQTVPAASVGQVSQEAKNILVDFPKTAAELFDYDVIVAFDPDWSRLTEDSRKQLMSWVSDHGGGLILVAGDVYTSQLANGASGLANVQDLYPVTLGAALAELSPESRADQPWPLALTREGREAGFLQLEENTSDPVGQWKKFPGVFRCYPTSGAKAGATVYARFADPRAQNEHGQPILCAAQFYGSGRTLYLGSPEMWRLRAVGEEYFDRFWIKTIREVGQGRLRRGTARGLLLLERSQYVLGQTIRVRANLLDAQLQPLDVETVDLDVLDPHGVPLAEPRVARRERNRPGQYSADFRGTIPGTYRVTIRPQPDDDKQNLAAKIDVVLPNLESDTPRQNAKLLTDLARETGGKYVTIERAAAEVPALLPDRGERFAVDEQLRTLWDREWVLYLLVGCLGVEWLTRKLLRLA